MAAITVCNAASPAITTFSALKGPGMGDEKKLPPPFAARWRKPPEGGNIVDVGRWRADAFLSLRR